MAFSTVGRVKLGANVVILVVSIIVLALSAKVNQFQEFFFMADLFPFALGIVTMVVSLVILGLEFGFGTFVLNRAQYQASITGALTILWLAFNGFSTSRWASIPMSCSSISGDDFADERAWCNNIQALKAFIWLEFILCFATSTWIFHYSFKQYNKGYKHVFQMSFSRYRPDVGMNGFNRGSEFLQYAKF